MTKRLLFISIFLYTFFCCCDLAFAQNISLNLGDASTGTATARIFSVLALITVLSLAPSIVIMMTSFTRLIVVFSITRSALATNATPPNMVLISLALFMTIFIMTPTFEKSWEQGIKPVIDEKIELSEGLEKAALPLKEFMVKHFAEMERTNSYWCGEIAGNELLPSELPADTKAVIEAIGAADICGFMKELEAQQNYRVFVMMPM